MRTMLWATILIVCAGASRLAAGADDERFDEARRQAGLNQRTDAGKKHDAAMAQVFQEHFVAWINGCTSATGARAPYENFEVALRIAADGSVLRGMVEPENAMSACVRDAAVAVKYPAPPADGYWALGGMVFN